MSNTDDTTLPSKKEDESIPDKQPFLETEAGKIVSDGVSDLLVAIGTAVAARYSNKGIDGKLRR